METTLLATKLFIPQVTLGLVIRPRLVQRLQGVLNNRLTLVSAPAGFGKTTIVSQWIQDSHIPAVWLSLEETDNDSFRFWDYFIGALQKISPSIGGKALPLLHSSQPVPIESMLIVLINDIANVSGDFVFILDDYHFIQSEAINQGVTFLLEHMPPKMHLIVATRVDPPLPLAHWRGRSNMLEIGADELRFTLEEASVLLKTILGLELSPEDLQAINLRAEGWAVGLKMAALSLGKRTDLKKSIVAFTGSQRYIMDYLLEEVLQYQSKNMRIFLLQTSVLTRMSGPLCDAVTQSTGSREKLLSLEKVNMFLVPLDDSREWYRYHHLFAELLRHQLDLESGKDMAYELHRRASWWYEDNGLFEEAIDHALLAQNWGRAMEIIGYPTIITRRTGSLTMFNWLRHIPEEILRSQGERYVNYMWALLSTDQHGAAEECLQYLDTVAGHDRHLQGRIAVARSAIAGKTGDFSRAEEYAEKALSLLNSDAYDEHATVSLVLGGILLTRSWYSEAEPLLIQSIELFRRVGHINDTPLPLTYLGTVAALRCRLNQAVNLYHEAMEIDPDAADPHLYLGDVYYRLNNLEAADLHHQQAVELFKLWGGSQIEFAYLHLAQTKMALGDREAAIKALEDADRLLSRGGTQTRTRACNMAYHAAIVLLDENIESAVRWIDDLVIPDILPFDIPYPAARLYLARKGKAIEAEQLHTLCEQYVQHDGHTGMIAVRIIQALDSLGPDNPLDYLTKALNMAKPAGIIRMFVDFGMELAPLLRQAIVKGIEPEYARKLLTIIEAEDRQRKIRKGELPLSPVSSAILSEREMDVLHLIASGLSDKQIAGKLVISLSTAKTHVHRIIEKLNTANRTQAVTQAKELKLI